MEPDLGDAPRPRSCVASCSGTSSSKRRSRRSSERSRERSSRRPKRSSERRPRALRRLTSGGLAAWPLAKKENRALYIASDRWISERFLMAKKRYF